MILNDDLVEAYSNRLVNLTDLKKMGPAQLDRVKALGTAAENLLKNKDFVLFIRQFQLESVDALTDLKSHSVDDNAQRIAVSNQLSGIDNFIGLLKKQVYLKNRVVENQNQQQKSDQVTP